MARGFFKGPGSKQEAHVMFFAAAEGETARLFQTIPNFIQPGPGAVVIQFSAGGSTCANRSNRLLSELDHDPTARQRREWCNRILTLRTLSQSDGVVLKQDAGVCLVVCAIERVYAGTITALSDDRRAIGIEHDGCFSVALLRADRDRLAGCFDCKRSRNAMRRQRIRETHRCGNSCAYQYHRELVSEIHDASPVTCSQSILGRSLICV